MPYYIVEHKNPMGNAIATKLVHAPTPNRAMTHVAQDYFTAQRATPDEIVRMMQDGYRPVEVEVRSQRGRPKAEEKREAA